MSEVVQAAAKALNEKMAGSGFDGRARFVIEEEGTILVDGESARVADEDADVTLSASADTFESILAGDLDPTTAFMSGKLAVDGDMGVAMQLGTALA